MPALLIRISMPPKASTVAFTAAFPFVRLAPGRNGGDLHVTDERKILFEAFDQIAADDLGMIEVELNAHIWPLNFGNDVGRLLDPAEEIIRPIARVERLDQERDVAL